MGLEGQTGCRFATYRDLGRTGLKYGAGEGDDQLWGSGRGAIAAGCHCRVPISVSYVPSIVRATNFTQTPKKTAMNFVLSFLQTLQCSLH